MGIPFWPDETPAGRTDDGRTDAPAVHDTEQAAEALSALASPVRLEVLVALHRAGPLAYTDLRTAVGLEDRGLFNYHLRQLDGLVASDDGTYGLTGRGEAVVDRVLSDPVFGSRSGE